MPKILIIEDDTAFCQMLQKFLTRHDFEVSVAYDLKGAKHVLDTTYFDIILSDVRLPEGDGIAFLSEIKSNTPGTHVILMTSFAEVKNAVSAMKKGAFDYIAKPFTPESILGVIATALRSTTPDSISEQVQKKHTGTIPKTQMLNLGWKSKASQQLEQYVALVAPTNMSVLLVGESGTGKEVTARMIHSLSNRSDNNFIAVDCGAIPKELATSEFFGHIKGSFTGAIEDKVGHFEASNGGTLFLDEIGNLSYENQVQLLRAIQERKIKRVGSTKEVPIDVRIIAATNEDLETAVDQGNFREDLFHRLNEFSIKIPSLKNRIEDLPQFMQFFLALANEELHKKVAGFSNEAEQVLMQYHWPGNLRELKNVIKRAVLFTKEEMVEVSALPENLRINDVEETESGFSKHKFEKERIIRALKQTNFNKSEAARLLNMTRKTLYNKINRYQLKV